MSFPKSVALIFAVLAGGCGVVTLSGQGNSNASKGTPANAEATNAKATNNSPGSDTASSASDAAASSTDFTLAERDHFVRIQNLLDNTGKGITSSCVRDGEQGGPITFELDKPTWKGHVVTDKQHTETENNDALQGAGLFKCEGTSMAIKRVCGSAEGRKAIQAKVKKIVCSHISSPEPTMSLAGGVLSVGVNATKVKGNGDVETLTKDFLGKNL